MLFSKSVAGVEFQPERGRMRPQQCDWFGELAARAAPAKFWIRKIALMAIGISEIVLTGLGNAIELVLWHVFGQPVARVLREVELVQPRMPVHANDLADPISVNLQALPIHANPVDLAVPFRWQTDVAGDPDLKIEFLVGADSEVLPAVGLVLWQVRQNDGRLWRVVQVAFDVVDL